MGDVEREQVLVASCGPRMRCRTSQSGCSAHSCDRSPTRNGAVQMPARRPRSRMRSTRSRSDRNRSGQGQPVADLGLVAVVELDDVDRQLELLDGVEVLEHVLLGHLHEVVVPGAPDRRRRPDWAHLQRGGVAVAPPARAPTMPPGPSSTICRTAPSPPTTTVSSWTRARIDGIASAPGWAANTCTGPPVRLARRAGPRPGTIPPVPCRPHGSSPTRMCSLSGTVRPVIQGVGRWSGSTTASHARRSAQFPDRRRPRRRR